MTSQDRKREKLAGARLAQAPWRGSVGQIGTVASKMVAMGRPPRGCIVGIVWAGAPDVDPVMEETPAESLLDELKVGPGEYFLKVRGSSMNDDGIEEGDLIQVRPVRPGTAPQDGETVLAEVGIRDAIGETTGRVTVKRFYRHGTKIRLQPANKSMNPQHYELDDVRVSGVVVNIIRKLPLPPR